MGALVKHAILAVLLMTFSGCRVEEDGKDGSTDTTWDTFIPDCDWYSGCIDCWCCPPFTGDFDCGGCWSGCDPPPYVLSCPACCALVECEPYDTGSDLDAPEDPVSDLSEPTDVPSEDVAEIRDEVDE